ncbi:MAG: ParB/RepB/Spo0J family partition protein [Solirubrobacterales bacterium]
MTTLTTPTLAIDEIVVPEGSNPRTVIDQGGLERLAANIERNEVLQPILVSEAAPGKFVLVAGERRLLAAKMAGRDRVPVTLSRCSNPNAAALAENLHREEMNPIDTARGIKSLKEEMGLKTDKAVGEEMGFSAAWVSLHLRALKLPEGVQTHIAEGHVPVDAERELRKIAEVSPRIAECVCELARRNGIKASEFRQSFDRLLLDTSKAKFQDPPAMYDVNRSTITELVAEPTKARDLGDRYLAAAPHFHETNPIIRFSEEEVDAARAAGCLIEHEFDQGGWVQSIAFITDAELAADLTERHIEGIEKRAAAAREQRRKEDEAAAKHRGDKNGDAPPAKTPHQEREARRKAARTANQDLARRIASHRGRKNPKGRQLKRAKAAILSHLADNPNLAARGLRLVLSQLQEVEHKQLKTTGETKEKVTYVTAEEANDWLVKRVIDAQTIDEAIEIWTDAILAAAFASEDELPIAMKVGGGGVFGTPAELLAADLKAIEPPAKRKAKK